MAVPGGADAAQTATQAAASCTAAGCTAELTRFDALDQPWCAAHEQHAELVDASAWADWPKAPIMPGVSIAAGRDAWQKFIRTADAEGVRRATDALQRLLQHDGSGGP